MRLFCAVWLAAGASLWAQGTSPKKLAIEYPVHQTAPGLSIGADYLVRSFAGYGQMWIATDYLVVEAALYTGSKEPIEVRQGRFSLRVNGKKQILLPQAPGMVAASFKYADWERRGTMVASAGVGDTAVILGRPRNTERFPGDPRPGQERLPQPPQSPPSENRSGIDVEPAKKVEEAVVDLALPEGLKVPPVSGYLYFGFKGKPQSIRSLDLIYDGPEGQIVLKIK